MAETMDPQRVKRIMQYTLEQFCKVKKEMIKINEQTTTKVEYPTN